MTDILLNESNASRRCVPLWCVQSNGTSAATNEAGGVFQLGWGGVSYGTGGTLSAISAPCGLYSANIRASVVSVVGNGGAVNYSSATVFGAMSPFQVVAYDPFTAPVTMPSDPASASAVSAGISAITTQLSLSSATQAVLLSYASNSSASLGLLQTNQSLSSATLAVILSQTSSIATAGQNAQAIFTQAASTPMPGNLKQVSNTTLTGSGTTADPWRPA